jgi:hypothetical protein
MTMIFQCTSTAPHTNEFEEETRGGCSVGFVDLKELLLDYTKKGGSIGENEVQT